MPPPFIPLSPPSFTPSRTLTLSRAFLLHLPTLPVTPSPNHRVSPPPPQTRPARSSAPNGTRGGTLPESPPQSSDELCTLLLRLAEPAYRDFAARLLPPNSAKPLLGVRLPLLRRLAQQLARDERAPQILREEGELWMEQTMLRGMLPGYLRQASCDERLRLIEDFVPSISNWSLCDSCCAGYRFARQHRERVWQHLQPYLGSREEFPARYGVVMLLDHFMQDPDWTPRIAEALLRQPAEGFYARMGVAWCGCELHLRYPELARPLLQPGGLPEASRRLALRKIRESRRSR